MYLFLIVEIFLILVSGNNQMLHLSASNPGLVMRILFVRLENLLKNQA